MKKFNLLKASSLILASYFIIGFSSCDAGKSNGKRNHYQQIDLSLIVEDKLNLENYLKNSNELKDTIEDFNDLYKEIYIFNLPNTYQEYQLFSLRDNEFVKIGTISKTGTKIYFDYLVNETNYLIKKSYFFKFDLSKNLEKNKKEITYSQNQSNYSYKFVEENDKKSFSVCCNDNNIIFEISLVKSDKYILNFRYDLLNNVEVEITSEEFKILYNSLVSKFNSCDLSTFMKDNKNILFNILKRGEKNTIYFEYDYIYEILNELTSNDRTRVK